MVVSSLFVEEDESLDPFDEALKAAKSPNAEEDKKQADPPQQGEAPKQEESNTGEEEVPFHKHPRFQEVYKSLKEEREARKELQARLTEFEGALAKKQEPQPVPEIPDWWSGDQESWAKFAKRDEMLIERAKQQAIAEFQREISAKQQKEVEEKTLAKEAIDTAVTELHDKYGEFDENKLYKVIDEFRPTTQDGSWWDFDRAFKIMQLQEQAESLKAQKNVESKKQVASIASAQDNPSSKKPTIKAGMNWREYYAQK